MLQRQEEWKNKEEGELVPGIKFAKMGDLYSDGI